MTTRDGTRDRYLSAFSIPFTFVTSVTSQNNKRVIERIDRENIEGIEESVKNAYGFSSKSLVALVTGFLSTFSKAWSQNFVTTRLSQPMTAGSFRPSSGSASPHHAQFEEAGYGRP
jgi:hypothetical protein